MPYANPRSGVYIVRCAASNKAYIGSSLNVDDRLSHHFGKLKRNVHPNSHLQFAFNFYGESEFSFEVLELTDKATRVERENHWILQLKTADRSHGYNNVVDAVSYQHSDETRAKISAAKSTPDAREKQAERMRQRFANPEERQRQAESSRRVRSMPEDRIRNSEKMKRHLADPEFKAKALAASQSPEARNKKAESLRGRKMSDSTRQAILEANAKEWQVIDPSGNIYDVINLNAFCREHGLPDSNMRATADGRQSHCKGWKCIRLDGL